MHKTHDIVDFKSIMCFLVTILKGVSMVDNGGVVRRLRRGTHRPEPVALDTHDYARKVGQRVQQRRLALGISQDALGAAIGMDRGQLSRVENGESALTTGNALKVCTALKLDIGELLSA